MAWLDYGDISVSIKVGANTQRVAGCWRRCARGYLLWTNDPGDCNHFGCESDHWTQELPADEAAVVEAAYLIGGAEALGPWTKPSSG